VGRNGGSRQRYIGGKCGAVAHCYQPEPDGWSSGLQSGEIKKDEERGRENEESRRDAERRGQEEVRERERAKGGREEERGSERER